MKRAFVCFNLKSPLCKIVKYDVGNSFYEKEGNTNRAKKMLATALELLKQLPSSAMVEQQSSVTVGELLEYVNKLL